MMMMTPSSVPFGPTGGDRLWGCRGNTWLPHSGLLGWTDGD